jgi:hypothetical protein
MFNLQPPRHISTLHKVAQSLSDGMSGAGESSRCIPSPSVGQPTETCLGDVQQAVRRPKPPRCGSSI